MNSSDNVQDIRKKIGQYSYMPKDVIGKGYSSVVYRAQNDSNGQTLALKLIDMKNIKGQVHRTLLSNQMEILKLLSNLQNIIKLYQIIPLKSHTCIVTQLCDGGDLAKMIKARKGIPEKEAIDILKEIINGYRGINRFGIVHRDLKPANIFFSDEKVKIADFGFAIRNSDLKKASNYNVGSPVYMPLQALNDNLYSSKSDIWAIGVIFYQMLTGHTPWRAKTEADLKRHIKAISIKSLIPANLSRISSDFLLKSLQVNPNLRLSPQEMIIFFDVDEETTNDQSFTSTNLRTNYLFRTRAVSQDKEERLGQTNGSIPKNTVTAPKSFRKISRLAAYNNLQKISEGHIIGTETNIGFQKIGQHKLANLARATAIGEDWIPDHKKTAAQLLSQIHFCRFFYKLIERMQTLGVGSQKLKLLLSTLIIGKFQELKQLTIINPRYAVIFRRTKQFEKIQEIIQQYTIKYEGVIKSYGQSTYSEALKEIEDDLTSQILVIHENVKSYQSLQGHADEVILLDYLITTKQLLLMNAKNDIEYFHKRSKIQAIVQGKPTKNITEEHFNAIVHKLRVFKMIS